MRDVSAFLEQLRQWLSGEKEIEAALLVGSFARGTARDDSVIDLVFISQTPQVYLQHEHWISSFGNVRQIENEDWGPLQSKRVFYENGMEVEFGITTPQWAETGPVDEGTRQVMRGGAQIPMDRNSMLATLLNAIQTGHENS